MHSNVVPKFLFLKRRTPEMNTVRAPIITNGT
jgi:hypothetical protein